MKTLAKIAVIVFKIAVFIFIRIVVPTVFGLCNITLLVIAKSISQQNKRATSGKTMIDVTYKGKRLENRALCFANSDKSQGYIRVNKHHVAVKKTRLGWKVK